ncbi:TadE/TadG family type IV pilus assembly protein [Altererythrobacter sp. H2]|uniref:TadE/TadG family type IV pilus assembly protein n=1 Tax=Altererythrobacter sp. H2 TaxID=3108391 RepID=UPI002B4BBA02|nr:TadE/TadG family type IV pilus assembly protein [Altererythrobacter sp. H2]WRK94346.1 TadE/TadG family type IV pilus assembly protein [Altererythrobacter sp. H2]
MRQLRLLKRDQRGAALVEFALVAPAAMLLMMGVFELGHTMYVQAIVNGAIQEAGRDSTVERATLGRIEGAVRRQVGRVAPDAQITFKRAFHTKYATIDRMEPFTDLNGDGECNDGEPYEDVNGNGTRDRARGKDGQGNARDVVVFQVDVVYDRLFPMPSLAGWSEQNTVVGRTMLRNQPFRQQDKQKKVRNCNGGGV